jgi:DNA-directed RNA polymerase subunit beta'
MTDEKGAKITVPSFNPIFMMADSGARGSAQQIRQLAGMRGLMASLRRDHRDADHGELPRGSDRAPVLHLDARRAQRLGRHRAQDRELRLSTRRLVDVAQDSIISEDNCGTLDGIEMTPLMEGGEIIEPLGDRVLGRVALEDVKDPFSGDTIVGANGEITESWSAHRGRRLERIKIRSRSHLPVQARRVRHVLWARSRARPHGQHGEAIGVIAAQSIGEPARSSRCAPSISAAPPAGAPSRRRWKRATKAS